MRILIILLLSICAQLIGAQTEPMVLRGVVQDERTFQPLEGYKVKMASICTVLL